ncbi:MAG: tetratricopeptide repeat protein [Spirochaetia bacterium]|nr:tetratricopeptide repeat protein [Spirochaetia bacterium]
MLSKQEEDLLNQYNAALQLYKSRKWSEAMAAFKKALEIAPNDGPSKLYLERSEQYMKNPPDDDWDGVFVMKTK